LPARRSGWSGPRRCASPPSSPAASPRRRHRASLRRSA
jgi:hypothetical protein